MGILASMWERTCNPAPQSLCLLLHSDNTPVAEHLMVLQKQKERDAEKLGRWKVEHLNRLLDLLDLPRGSGQDGTKVPPALAILRAFCSARTLVIVHLLS